MTIDKHTLAIISIAGSSLDVLGALYLAYDLLGGEHGPLRTLTRAVTYGALFGFGYGLALGPIFGLCTGVTHGLTLGWELSRAARHERKPGLWYDVMTSAIRGCGFALGAAYLFGPMFGIAFGALIAVGQIVGYRLGIRPTLDLRAGTRPRLTKRQLLAAVNRAIGCAIAAYLSAFVAHQRGARALKFGLEVGLLVGVVTAITNACMPFVEWAADRVPARRMGVFGVALILIGFTLQSVQYWLTLLDVDVR